MVFSKLTSLDVPNSLFLFPNLSYFVGTHAKTQYVNTQIGIYLHFQWKEHFNWDFSIKSCGLRCYTIGLLFFKLLVRRKLPKLLFHSLHCIKAYILLLKKEHTRKSIEMHEPTAIFHQSEVYSRLQTLSLHAVPFLLNACHYIPPLELQKPFLC